MATKQIVCTALNISGGSAPFVVTLETVDLPVITSATGTPQSAAPGTLRLVKINAVGATSFTATDNGVPLTPGAQPGEFTIVF